MKRLLLLGLGAFALVLLVVLPARWVAPLLPVSVQCATWRGSVWSGQCEGLQVASGQQPARFDSLRWRLRPLSLLRLALAADVEFTAPAGTAQGRVERRLTGALALRDVTAQARVDRQLLGALPVGWHGQLHATGLAFVIDGRTLRELAGQVLLADMVDSRNRPLGSYRLAFPAGGAAPWNGTLQDTGGPFEVQARVVVQADRSWTLDGTVLPRGAGAAAFSRQLEVLGPMEAGGRHRLSLSGTFN